MPTTVRTVLVWKWRFFFHHAASHSDDTSHAEDEYFGSLDKVLETVDILTSAISELNLVVFPVMGNHDSHPKSQYPDDPQDDLYSLTGDIWKNWLESYDAYQQFKDNGM